MEHNLNDTIALLATFPGALNVLLRDLPDTWTSRNEGENTMNVFDVVGHLIHAEHVDWIPRARMILESGEGKSFEPFDRWGFREYCADKTLPQLLDEFARLRTGNLDTLRQLSLSAEDLAKRGRHPAFGSVTLSQLLATWAVHDLTHLHQIARVMAHQYREPIGPWTEYLGVMLCNGHSA
jgi:hypothetical protein